MYSIVQSCQCTYILPVNEHTGRRRKLVVQETHHFPSVQGRISHRTQSVLVEHLLQ